MYEFRLPDLGEGIHEAEILKWHVEVDGAIQEDEPLVDVETDKASVTIPSPKGGTVRSLSGAAGDTITVGQVIAVIDDGSADTAREPETKKPIPPPAEKKPPEPSADKKAQGPVPAAPATRRLARETGVDINQVTGSGPAGRITPEDVRAFAGGEIQPVAGTVAAPVPAPVPEPAATGRGFVPIPYLEDPALPDFGLEGPIERIPFRSIRRKVARKMVTSSLVVPHVAHMDEADVTALEDFRRKERERRAGQPGGQMTLLAFVVKAVAAGLKAAPAFNASIDPVKDEILYKKYYNIGIAMDTGRGLVVPVIQGADCKSILQVSADIEDLAARGREDKLTFGDFQAGTFTISNVGPLGGTALVPIVNYPEVAILGMGRAQDKPVVRDGQVVIRKMLPLTLSFDHRVADGADAARFVTALVEHLSDPNLLLLDS